MSTQIPYFAEVNYLDQLNIDNVGDLFLSACNSQTGDMYFLSIQTEFGFSQIIQFGPLNDVLQSKNYSIRSMEFEYSKKKLEKEISLFCNPRNTVIDQAFEITKEDFVEKLNMISQKSLYDLNIE